MVAPTGVESVTIAIPESEEKVSLLGEKLVTSDRYMNSQDPGDNECAYTGMNNDILRSTSQSPMKDMPWAQRPTSPSSHTFRFGSAHVGGFNVCFGDGSVRMIKYSISLTNFTPMGDIKATQAINFE